MTSHQKAPVALVTGGAIRIGRILVEQLLGCGYKVIVHHHSSNKAANELLEQYSNEQVYLIQADLTESDAINKLWAQLPSAFSKVQLLINSASVFPDNDTIDASEHNIESIFKLNSIAPWRMSQAFKQQVEQQSIQNAHIINILDARLAHCERDHLIYRMTKAALTQMNTDLAVSLAPNIRVNAIALGAILAPEGKPPSYLNEMAQTQIPLKVSGNKANLHKALNYLLDQDFVTGEVLRLDGGQFL